MREIKYEYETNNIVGSGNFDHEFDTTKLKEYLNENGEDAEKDKGATQGCEYKFHPDLPRTTIHNTGTYIIRADSVEEIKRAYKKLNEKLIDLEIIDEPNKQFEIVNIVAEGTFNVSKIDIYSLASKLENGDLENEQFPAVIYDGIEKTSVNIYPNGKFVIVGAKNHEEIDECLENIRIRLTEIADGSNTSKETR